MSPLERAARALYERHAGPNAKVWELISQSHRTYWRDNVQAVIAALKYEDGTDEGTLIEVSNKHRVEAVSLSEAYDAMLDAAAR